MIPAAYPCEGSVKVWGASSSSGHLKAKEKPPVYLSLEELVKYIKKSSNYYFVVEYPDGAYEAGYKDLWTGEGWRSLLPQKRKVVYING